MSVDDLSSIIHTKYNGIVDIKYIKLAIPIHIDRFFKSVIKTAIVMEPTPSSPSDSCGSSAEMWVSISLSQTVSCNTTI